MIFLQNERPLVCVCMTPYTPRTVPSLRSPGRSCRAGLTRAGKAPLFGSMQETAPSGVG